MLFDHLPAPDRRRLLRATAAAGLGTWAGLSLAGAAAKPAAPRLVLVILRGGLDGLSAAPALGDPAFADARGALGRFATPALPLDGLMALHPALTNLHRMVQQREALVLHAVGLPYRERSHFDGQQVLESGGARPFELDTGWLGRAMTGGPGKALALQAVPPLVLRGHSAVDTWAPATRPDPAPDLVARLERLYAADPGLAGALNRARELRLPGAMPDNLMTAAPAAPGMASGPGVAGAALPPGRQLALTLARQAAQFLILADGPQVAVLSLGGWDTHANQAAENGPLTYNLRTLDGVLAALREGLVAASAGDAWQRTVVLVVTEFGRTVAINGTQGTDHGSGGVAFALGGAVQGGRVLTDWPGLAPAQRFEGRDLRATTDLRALFKTVLTEHLGLPVARVSQSVLPGTAALTNLPILRG